MTVMQNVGICGTLYPILNSIVQINSLTIFIRTVETHFEPGYCESIIRLINCRCSSELDNKLALKLSEANIGSTAPVLR